MTWCQGPGLCPGGGWVLEGPVQLGSQKGAGRPSATAAIEGRRRATHDKGALFIPRMCLPHLKVKREDVDCRSRWPCPYRHVPRIHVAVGMVPPYPRLWWFMTKQMPQLRDRTCAGWALIWTLQTRLPSPGPHPELRPLLQPLMCRLLVPSEPSFTCLEIAGESLSLLPLPLPPLPRQLCLGLPPRPSSSHHEAQATPSSHTPVQAQALTSG